MSKRNKYDSIIEHYIKLYPNLIYNKTQLARKIIAGEHYSFNEDSFRKTVRRYLNKYKNKYFKNQSTQSTQPDIVIPYNSSTIKDVPRYQIANEEYIWESKHGTFSIPIKDADQLFYEYSRHGLNLSSTSVRLKHNIPIKMWFSLKHHLSLYKDSHIISPYTLDHTPQDQLRSIIHERMMAKEQDKENVIIEEHNKATIEEYNKLIKQLKTKDIAIEKMLDELSETIDIPEIQYKTFSPISPKKTHIVVAIADLHIGAEAKNLMITPDFNYSVLVDRLNIIAEKINSINAAKVSIMFLGDIIESITGLNHISTWQSIESGAYGATVFKNAVEIIIRFLNKINNVHNVYGIGGNHDRLTPDKKMDPYNSVAEMIFYTLKKIYEKSKIKIKYHHTLQSINIDNINYIITHGDKNIFKKKNLGSDSVLSFGQPGMFNIVLTAHLHSRDIIADHSLYRWIQVPAVFSGNFYSESNNFIALPGFITIYNDGKYPVVTDYSI